MKKYFLIPIGVLAIGALFTLTTISAAPIAGASKEIAAELKEPTATAGASKQISNALISALNAQKRQKDKNEQENERETANTDEIAAWKIDLLARLMQAECGTLGETAMIYCGSVVLNREISEHYPDGLWNVIYQPGQYQCITNGSIERPATKEALELAKTLLENGSRLPEGVVYQAEFPQGFAIYITLGNQYYCYY